MGKISVGIDCKLYRGTANTKASTEVKGVSSVTVNLNRGDADVTTRAANGWKISAATLREATIEVTIPYDGSDADVQAFRTAYFSETGAMSIFVDDGSGSGLDCDVIVTDFNMDQPLEDAVKANVTMKPTMLVATSGGTARAPQWNTFA